MAQTLILVRGAQGSGKTTFVKNVLTKELASEGRSFAHFEADMYFMTATGYEFRPELLKDAHNWCINKTAQAFKDGYSAVVVSNTFTSIKELIPYFKIGLDYRVTLKVYHCLGEFQNEHGVPEAIVQRKRDEYESLDTYGFNEIKINQ